MTRYGGDWQAWSGLPWADRHLWVGIGKAGGEGLVTDRQGWARLGLARQVWTGVVRTGRRVTAVNGLLGLGRAGCVRLGPAWTDADGTGTAGRGRRGLASVRRARQGKDGQARLGLFAFGKNRTGKAAMVGRARSDKA